MDRIYIKLERELRALDSCQQSTRSVVAIHGHNKDLSVRRCFFFNPWILADSRSLQKYYNLHLSLPQAEHFYHLHTQNSSLRVLQFKRWHFTVDQKRFDSDGVQTRYVLTLKQESFSSRSEIISVSVSFFFYAVCFPVMWWIREGDVVIDKAQSGSECECDLCIFFIPFITSEHSQTARYLLSYGVLPASGCVSDLSPCWVKQSHASAAVAVFVHRPRLGRYRSSKTSKFKFSICEGAARMETSVGLI